MTTMPEAREAIYQFFLDGWLPDTGVDGYTLNADGTSWDADPNGARTPYTFDNEEFDPPDGPWVRFSFRNRNRGQETLGAAPNRRFGTRSSAFVQYFEPPGSGTATADSHMDKALSIFEGKRITGTTLRVVSATARELGPDPDKRWWGGTVEIVTDYDEQK